MSLLFGYGSELEYVEENIDMNGNRILDLPDPIEDDEPVTTGYADQHYSGAVEAEKKVIPARKDRKVIKAILARKDRKVIKAILARKDRKVIKAILARKDRKVIKAILARKDRKAIKAIPVHEDRRVREVRKDLEATSGRKV